MRRFLFLLILSATGCSSSTTGGGASTSAPTDAGSDAASANVQCGRGGDRAYGCSQTGEQGAGSAPGFCVHTVSAGAGEECDGHGLLCTSGLRCLDVYQNAVGACTVQACGEDKLCNADADCGAGRTCKPL